MQRPHRANRCPGLGWPSPVTLKPQPGQSRLQRNFSRSLRTICCWPPPFFPGGFAGGAGGAVTLSRAAISVLVSFSLGLDRPSSRFHWSCSPRSQSSGLFAITVSGEPCLRSPRGLKCGVGVNHLPLGCFAANGAWLAVQVMAHNLTCWAARVGLGEQLVTTKTLRRFFALAGRLTRSARRLTLHLPQRRPWETQFNRALARLRAIPRPTDIPMAVLQTHPQLSPPVSLLAFCLADCAPHHHCGPPSSYLCGCLTPPLIPILLVSRPDRRAPPGPYPSLNR